MPVEPYSYQFAPADYYVMVGYILLISSLGLILKKLCHSSRDFLIGGNKIPWWLAGSSIFMMSFSAWTFTGAAGFAYQHGILIILLFYFNVFAYLFAGRFLAARIRQTRNVTFGQIIRERFGRLGEQFFVWVQVPTMLFSGSIWLLGLAVFVGVAFGVPMQVTILITGSVILIYSTLSGSWAVMTSDFLQSVVLMALSFIIAVLTLVEVGGVGGLIRQIEPSRLQLTSVTHSWVWILAYGVQISIIFNSVLGANRYLAVRDGKNARKAAYLASLLFLVGPVIWFIPPLAASFIFPDIGSMLPDLNHPNDGAYVLMGLHLLPAGLAGLLVMVIFAATLSSMDTSINVNAGILTMNVYKAFIRPDASDRELFIASRCFNVLCGITVTSSAYLLSMQDQMNLFDLMLLMSSAVALPLAVPCVLIFVFRKTARWAAVASVVAGGAFSFYGVQSEWHLFIRVFGIIGIASAMFLIAGWSWRFCNHAIKEQVNIFYDKLEKPVDASVEVQGREDVSHLYLVGKLAMLIAGGLVGLLFFPNQTEARLIILATLILIGLIGFIMYASGVYSAKRAASQSEQD